MSNIIDADDAMVRAYQFVETASEYLTRDEPSGSMARNRVFWAISQVNLALSIAGEAVNASTAMVMCESTARAVSSLLHAALRDENGDPDLGMITAALVVLRGAGYEE